ncbi:DUF6924 domain-containing protein [Nocardiopsis tropica]|uniref:DUF6924 domain-containing protein n=1 Tax=Nocardiopsis tropica TaxID=109330 RepID=A0ABU7KNJ5_9ACTN|nr:hypothetical protein [Nocardiopsis umidischolae]MEE2050860.1 hypothetical protein [Nocardiopsis umidischolae]
MRRPTLPLPPVDDAVRVHGMLLIRTDHGDDVAWDDVLSRMGDLPGLVGPRSGHGTRAAPEQEPIPRRLVVVDDPAWRGAGPEEVGEALERDGNWVPDMVLLATDRTAADARLRPLLAFRGSGGDAFRITPRQAALTYLVLHRQYTDDFAEYYEEWAPAEPGWEPDEDETVEEREAGLPEPAGAHLETLNPPPRYEPPAAALPLLTQENGGLLVRTDFTDEAAWAALMETVRRPGPGHGDSIDDFGDHIDVVDDPVFEGATPEQLMALVRKDPEDPEEMTAEVVLVADGETMRDPGRPVLVVPVEDRVGWAFRIDPDLVGIMVVNLAIGNQDIEDYMGPDMRAHFHGTA